jgi:hypothetical protein
MGRLPSKSGGAAYRRLHHRLLRPVFSNIVINNVTATTTSAKRTVHAVYCCLYVHHILRVHVLLLLIFGIVMLNILELIMEIVPNFPTH